MPLNGLSSQLQGFPMSIKLDKPTTLMSKHFLKRILSLDIKKKVRVLHSLQQFNTEKKVLRECLCPLRGDQFLNLGGF